MPPVPCSTEPLTNITLGDAASLQLAKDDRNALLYIVVTLLFYSMGIIVGIITYLKRERRELLEDKTFDVYFQMKSDPYTTFKSERVQMVAARLAELEKKQLDKVTLLSEEPSCSKQFTQRRSSLEVNKADSSQSDVNSSLSDKSACSNSTSTIASSPPVVDSPSLGAVARSRLRQLDDPEVESDLSVVGHSSSLPVTSDNDSRTNVSDSSTDLLDVEKLKLREFLYDDESDNSLKQRDDESDSALTDKSREELLERHRADKRSPRLSDNQRSNHPRGSTSGEQPIAYAVAKLFESERRGGLRMSPKALHLFDRGKRKFPDKQLSLDVAESRRRVIPRLQNRQLSVDIPDRELVSTIFTEMEQVRPLLEEDDDDGEKRNSDDGYSVSKL